MTPEHQPPQHDRDEMPAYEPPAATDVDTTHSPAETSPGDSLQEVR